MSEKTYGSSYQLQHCEGVQNIIYGIARCRGKIFD